MPRNETSGFRPHDVTMPQLGMAQDAGKIVSWLKAPGDAVSKGDALFEVETDKAVMEVEAPADGFLTGVKYGEGDDVPVGHLIARISDTAEADAPEEDRDGDDAAPDEPAAGSTSAGDALPEGHSVTMPQLGMAQDSGLLVNWLKAPGDKVAADDILFEVETDKSTMEVTAGRDGYLAATLAEAGEDVPVGDPVAIISAGEPEAPVARSVKDAAAPAPPVAVEDTAGEAAAEASRPSPTPAPTGTDGRVLASPKMRRLALQDGLDLGLLVKAGHSQPFHVADLDTLRALAAKREAPAAQASAAGASRRLTATCTTDGTRQFCAWAAEHYGLTDAMAVLAGLAAASLGAGDGVTVTVEHVDASRTYAVPPGRSLSAVAESDERPALILRDLRGTRLSGVDMGAEDAPVLTITDDGAGLSITLECAVAQLDAPAAIRLLTEFAGRMEQPLRHLL